MSMLCCRLDVAGDCYNQAAVRRRGLHTRIPDFSSEQAPHGSAWQAQRTASEVFRALQQQPARQHGSWQLIENPTCLGQARRGGLRLSLITMAVLELGEGGAQFNYVVSAAKPSSVQHSAVGHFTSAEDLNLVIRQVGGAIGV